MKKIATAEHAALENLKMIENILNALSEEEVNTILDAIYGYRYGNRTRLELDCVCRKYDLTATEALVAYGMRII